MQIPRLVIDNYTTRLNSLSNATKEVVKNALSSIEYGDIAELRELLIERLEPIFGYATDVAAAYAADFYDEVRSAAIGEKANALADSGRNPAATEGFIRAVVGKVDGTGLESILPRVQDRADYEIKRAAGECVYTNGARDQYDVRYARVPSGDETCMFCLMLASRGAVYHSAKTADAGHRMTRKVKGDDGSHYHANCDCRIVPVFELQTIEGYDPDAIYDQWKDSAHAEYMKRRNAPDRKRESKFEHESINDEPSFSGFEDVKRYLYAAENKKDLEHRFSVLGNIFGFGSEQLQSQSVKNALRHVEKRL